MEVDMTKVMILLQRRYNSVREVDRLTKELEKVIARGDEVSTMLILEMRGEELGKIDQRMEEIWEMGVSDKGQNEILRDLLLSDPVERVGKSREEEKIFEIRQKTEGILKSLRVVDQRLNQKLTGKKSYYNAGALAGHK